MSETKEVQLPVDRNIKHQRVLYANSGFKNILLVYRPPRFRFVPHDEGQEERCGKNVLHPENGQQSFLTSVFSVPSADYLILTLLLTHLRYFWHITFPDLRHNVSGSSCLLQRKGSSPHTRQHIPAGLYHFIFIRVFCVPYGPAKVQADCKGFGWGQNASMLVRRENAILYII